MTEKRRTIIRAERHDQPYFMLARSVAQNTNLSYEALGLLTYLLSKPGDWVVQPDTLMRAKSGRDKVYRLLRELIAAGHVEKRAHRGDHQRIVGVEYIVYEIPRTVSPLPEKPYTVNPDTEKPDTANPHTTDKREEQTTEPQKAVTVVEPEPLPERPNVYGMYERQFGMTLTPGIADTLRDMVRDYGEDWTNDALTITATSGHRGNLRYAAAILRNWQRDGREPEKTAATVAVVDEKTAWRATQKARPNVRYDTALDMVLPAFNDEDDRRRYITEYLNLAYIPLLKEAAS